MLPESTEIAKRAALALLHQFTIGDDFNERAEKCRQYLEAYDYAKSIGAIE